MRRTLALDTGRMAADDESRQDLGRLSEMDASAPADRENTALDAVRAEEAWRDCQVQGAVGPHPQRGIGGGRRRACGGEIERMKKVLGDGYEHERNGLVLTGCPEIMKCNIDGGWQNKKGWGMAGLSRGDVMDRVKKA